MKIPFILTAIAVLSISTAQANPNQTAPKPKAASPAKVQQAKRPPMVNHWDANAWDPAGAADFWHATSDAKTAPKPAPRKATKGSRLVKKLFGKRG